jgi:actin-related protein 5
MAGIDSAGLGEVLQNVLARFTDSEKSRLVGVRTLQYSKVHPPKSLQNVFVTGSPSQPPGLIPRLQANLRPILPPEIVIKTQRAVDPSSDAWNGMSDFVKCTEFPKVGVTREEYAEWGGERIKRWWGGNWNASLIS